MTDNPASAERPSTSWQEWLVVQDPQTDHGEFATFLLRVEPAHIDFGSEWVREGFRSLFSKFERDTEGMIVCGPPINGFPMLGGGMIAELRENMTQGNPIDAGRFLGFLDLLEGLAGVIGVALKGEADGSDLRPVLRKVHGLLTAGRPVDEPEG